MLDQYFIVHKSVLPEYFEKVVEAKRLLENGSVRDVSKAAMEAGISRSTFYKYRDYVFEPSQMAEGRHAVLTMVLSHETGVLSRLLGRVSAMGASVLTITQSLPVRQKAGVTLSLDVGGMTASTNELLSALESAAGVEQVRLVAVE
ncbi:MAG: ACT domain-containing protein [Clostridiaceae bacterium]|nr:ACT domain-containing protein [Clostridiaceae bacterium]